MVQVANGPGWTVQSARPSGSIKVHWQPASFEWTGAKVAEVGRKGEPQILQMNAKCHIEHREDVDVLAQDNEGRILPLDKT